MSETERAKWNMKAVCEKLGIMLIFNSVILLIGGLLILLDIFPIITLIISWAAFTVLVIEAVIHVNISKKFKNPK
jgi:hypothetical protein